MYLCFPVAQTVKHLHEMWETQVQSLGWEDPLEKEMASHSSILDWRILWTKEPGGLYIVLGVTESDTSEQLHFPSRLSLQPATLSTLFRAPTLVTQAAAPYFGHTILCPSSQSSQLPFSPPVLPPDSLGPLTGSTSSDVSSSERTFPAILYKTTHCLALYFSSQLLLLPEIIVQVYLLTHPL